MPFSSPIQHSLAAELLKTLDENAPVIGDLDTFCEALGEAIRTVTTLEGEIPLQGCHGTIPVSAPLMKQVDPAIKAALAKRQHPFQSLTHLWMQDVKSPERWLLVISLMPRRPQAARH